MRHLTPLSSRNPRIIGVQQSVGERVWPSAMMSCNISFLSFSLPFMHKMVNKCHLALLSREVPPGNDRTGGLLHCVYSVIALVCSFAYLIPLKSSTQFAGEDPETHNRMFNLRHKLPTSGHRLYMLHTNRRCFLVCSVVVVQYLLQKLGHRHNKKITQRSHKKADFVYG